MASGGQYLLNRGNSLQVGDLANLALDSQLIGDFAAGPVGHTASAGSDYSRSTLTNADAIGLAPPLNIFAARYDASIPAPGAFSQRAEAGRFSGFGGGFGVRHTRRDHQDPRRMSARPGRVFRTGGIMGAIGCMNDPVVTGFLADRGARAKPVTSVCPDSLVLGAAGLLNGYRATSYWAVADLLPLIGATHAKGRVVRDRNRITAGGVTAGIDFGLELAALLRGEEEARGIQLTIEYSPQPPFRNGTPEEAGAARVADARSQRTWMGGRAKAAALAAGARLGIGA